MNTYLVSGATGLIGSAVVRALAARGDRVIAAARNAAKALDMFAGLSGVGVVRWDVTAPAEIAGNVDYIVHAASETASKAFVEDPGGVRRVIVEGTRNALTLAAEKHVKGMVFLSTFEVLLDIDPQSPRASYPQAKLEAERLCRESGIPVRIARLVQTFGPGVARGDKRVFSQFAEAIADGRDIVLHTEGRTARCYCYIDDAVEAILLLLEKGVAGEAYIVANPDTYCTIREMAEMLCRAHPKSKVVVDLGAAAGKGYAPEFQMRLTAEPLEALGWKAKTGLAEAFRKLLESWKG